MMLKLYVWRTLCSVVRLDITIFIGISVWAYIFGYSKNSDFENCMKILRSGIFPMALNVKALKLDKIGHFLLKKPGSLHIILKIYTDIGTYLFFSRPSKEEKIIIIINILFLQFSFLRLKPK